VDCEPRHCASKDTLSELDFAHVCKCVLGRQHPLFITDSSERFTSLSTSKPIDNGQI
jgi:hypothetical protein